MLLAAGKVGPDDVSALRFRKILIGIIRIIDYIKAVLEKGSFGAFIFHGVGEEPMRVSEEDHETMLKFLDAHRNEIWVTTFQEATDYLISYRQRNKQ